MFRSIGVFDFEGADVFEEQLRMKTKKMIRTCQLV